VEPAAGPASRRDRLLFLGLVAVQMAASQVILWRGLPVYRRLMTDSLVAAGTTDLILTSAAAVLMLGAYGLAFRLQGRIAFRRHALVGHLMLFLGEFSFFFASALAAVVLFERSAQPEFVAWKVSVLAVILFAAFCHKHQLETLGRQLIADHQAG
jgi:hypothetical protein